VREESQPLAPAPGDAERFRQLFTRFFPRLVSYFRSCGFATQEAEDLSQNAMWNVYRAGGSLRAEESLEAWIYTIARNQARDEWRRRGRQGESDPLPESLEDERPSAEETAGQRQQLDRTLAALAKLPAGMRTCLLLHVQQGLSYQEIAARLVLALPTVKVQIWNARRRLKELLEEGECPS
jgi:RNA polymerase sigma-70 factor (ECF subfamily)